MKRIRLFRERTLASSNRTSIAKSTPESGEGARERLYPSGSRKAVPHPADTAVHETNPGMRHQRMPVLKLPSRNFPAVLKHVLGLTLFPLARRHDVPAETAICSSGIMTSVLEWNNRTVPIGCTKLYNGTLGNPEKGTAAAA